MKQIAAVEGVRGIHIMPVMWESVTPEIVEKAGLLPRPVPAPSEELVGGPAQ